MVKIGSFNRAVLSWFTFLLMVMPSFTVSGEDQKVSVEASVDREIMEEGDTFELTVTVSSDHSVSVDEPHAPIKKDLELINSWSSSEINSTYVNGQFLAQQNKVFHYTLSPQKAGKISISPITVKIDGKEYQTQSQKIEVTKAGSHPKKPQNQPNQNPVLPDDPFDDADQLFSQLLRRHLPGQRQAPSDLKDSFFVQLEVDKNKVYEGEQITASWYLYTRSIIRDIDTLKYPDLSGFWKEEIELATRLNWQTEILNGVPYKKALLVSYALFPIKVGKAIIDPYKVKCSVLSDAGFGFGQQFFYTKSSKEQSIEVMPVPVANRPTDFTGAVGDFSVQSSLDQNTVSMNQPLTLKVKFEGKGNAKLINLPKLNLSPSIEVYDTKTESKFFKNGQSYKQFEVLLIPREVGSFKIPKLEFSLFDPKKGTFYQRVTGEIPFTVEKGNQVSNKDTSPESQSKNFFDKPEISSPQEPESPDLILTWEKENSWWQPVAPLKFWISIYTIIILFLGIYAYWLLGGGKKSRDLQMLYKVRLQKLQKRADKGEWRRVGGEGINLIYFVLGELSEGKSSSQELEKLIFKIPPSVRREIESKLRKLMGQLEILGFAPEAIVGSIKDKKELKKLVEDLDALLSPTLKAIIVSESEVTSSGS